MSSNQKEAASSAFSYVDYKLLNACNMFHLLEGIEINLDRHSYLHIFG